MRSKKTTKKITETRISYIAFKANMEVDRFRHFHVEAGAEIAHDADPGAVLTELKSFVNDQLLQAKTEYVRMKESAGGPMPEIVGCKVGDDWYCYTHNRPFAKCRPDIAREHPLLTRRS